jgi:molybdate transport system substrate-binding protein
MVRPLGYVLAVFVLLVLAAVGCGNALGGSREGPGAPLAGPTPGASPPPGAGVGSSGDPLLILAASDLQFALRDIAALFEQETGRKVTLSLGSTGNFAAQIEHGAPADIFFAADRSFVDRLARQGLVRPEARQLYAVGRIALVPASGAPLAATSLEDLSRPEISRIAIANPEHAPYGRAAKQALESRQLWSQVAPRVVYGENVAQAFQFVQTGNVDAGIVALSIVMGVPGTPHTLVDDSLHDPLLQEAAILARSRRPDEARQFLDYVNGPSGRPIMERYGFTPPDDRS